jgi:lysozyme family protein
MTPGRREILIGAASALLGSTAARAQGANPLAALGLGDDVLGLIQTKPADIVRVLAAILKLETTADRRRLPASTLSFKTDGDIGSTLPTTQGGLYAIAVPRLIRVMDRADGEDPGMTDEAGKLLAELNAAQREIPEAFQDNPPPPSRATSFDVLKAEYSTFFATTQLRPDRSELADWHRRVMLQYRSRYEAVEKTTGVPWFLIGAIHGLEASYNFRAHFHNGDFPLSARTRQVPANRPPNWRAPYTWEASAKDALTLLGFVGKSDWTLERTLYRLEAYNGFGYRRLGVPSPYLWSFSNHYETGKFVADGKWNPAARSQQCGAATKIKMLVDAGVVSFA